MSYFRTGYYRTGYYLTPAESESLTINNYYDWEFRLYHKSGGVKKDWFWGLEDVPITKVDFEINKRLMGAGTVELTHVDFPVDIEDRFEIWHQNSKLWEGLVDSAPDPKGGKIKIVPFQQQLDERLVNFSFSSASYSTALQNIIEDLDECDVTWDEDYIDITSTETLTKDYVRVTAKKAIEDIMKNMDDREWGVTKNRQFTVYKPSTSIDKIIYNAEDKWYKELEITNDDKRIKDTRREIYKKSTDSGQTDYVGNVGYDIAGNTYATLSIEKTKRRKDTKYVVSANVTDTFAKDLAYAELQSNAQLSTSIKLKGLRKDKYDGDIGDYVRCIDDYEKILKTLMSTDGVTEITSTSSNWTGEVSIYSDDYVSGSACIQFLAATAENDIYYDFGEVKRYIDIEKVCIMVQSSTGIGKLLEFGMADSTATLWDNPYPLFLNDTDLWELKEINPTENTFRYMGFRLIESRDINRYINITGQHLVGAYALPNIYATYYIDRIQIFAMMRAEAEGNIVQKKYKLDKDGLTLDITLGDYGVQENEDLKDMRLELEKIKEIQQKST